jgi:hypothetical protein
MAVGIDTLKAGIHSLVGIAIEGILLAKKAPAIVAEAKDIDASEGVALVIQVATEEAPRVMAALKS